MNLKNILISILISVHTGHPIKASSTTRWALPAWEIRVMSSSRAASKIQKCQFDRWMIATLKNEWTANEHTTQRLTVILYLFISTNSLLRLLFADGFKGGSRHQYNHTTTTSSVRFLCKGFSHREFEVKRKKKNFLVLVAAFIIQLQLGLKLVQL